MIFPTDLASILERVNQVNPVEYARSRNFLNGAVSYLSPYISRGVISPKFVWENVQKRGFGKEESLKFVQELAWREYFQRVWQAKGELLDQDLRQAQPDVQNHGISQVVLAGETGIDALDKEIRTLHEAGYIHNHSRMYLASLCTNIAKSHWKTPAKWMYYHLLDADWASNACSWQWVAGAFSSKKYYANQENINKYTGSTQAKTFLDVGYEAVPYLKTPSHLAEIAFPDFETKLPTPSQLLIKSDHPTLLYNFYNVDPFWHENEEGNRVLLLEPSFFARYPVSEKTIQFVLELAKNISDIQVYVGEFQDFKRDYFSNKIHYKEHPTNRHYEGEEEERTYLFPAVKGYYSSFFAYWKRCEKCL